MLMGEKIRKKQMIPETFNKYFLSVAENIKEITEQKNINPQ
jgi:hypothetical protein